MIKLLLFTFLVVISSWPVWAGDSNFKVPPPYSGGTVDCRYRYDASSGIVAECKMRDEPTCEQRMHEAMKEMDEVIDQSLWNLVRGKKRAQLWRQTMKDCVEGK